VLPEPKLTTGENAVVFFQVLSAVVSIGGVWIAYRIFFKKPSLAERFRESRLRTFFLSGWGFDRLYDRMIVKPIVWLSETDKDDIIDMVYTFIARTNNWFHFLLSLTQNGKLRWYALTVTIGVAIILTFMISL